MVTKWFDGVYVECMEGTDLRTHHQHNKEEGEGQAQRWVITAHGEESTFSGATPIGKQDGRTDDGPHQSMRAHNLKFVS